MPLDAWHQPYDQMAVKKMEILGKIQAGWGRWRRVSGVACDKKLNQAKMGRYKSVVRPVVMYGAVRNF